MAAVVAVGPGAAAEIAQAQAPTSVSVISGGLLVEAQPETVNEITLSYSLLENEIHVVDTAGMQLPAEPTEEEAGDPTPCRQVELTEVACPFDAVILGLQSPSIGVQLDDLDDTLVGDVSLGISVNFAARAGPGADSLTGGPGADRLLGGDGADRLFGGAGDDVIGGESGQDVIRGEAESDIIAGGPGHDSQRGGSGHDWIWTADDQRDPVINCGQGSDRPAIVDHGLDARPESC